MNIKEDKTKEAILKVASEMFAENGYEKTSIREISKQAGVNIAAVNYHFGNKTNLFAYVIERWKENALKEYPADICGDESIDPKKRLYIFIETQLMHTLYTEEYPWMVSILTWDIDKSEDIRNELIQKNIAPRTEVLTKIIAEIMNREVDYEIRSISANIFAMCYQQTPMLVMNKYFNYKKKSKEDIKKIANQIYKFALAGIEGINNNTN